MYTVFLFLNNMYDDDSTQEKQFKEIIGPK